MPDFITHIAASALGALKTVFVYLGAGGGLWYVVDSFLKRPRVRVRILEENFDARQPEVAFELENAGITPTSVKPEISMTGPEYYPVRQASAVHESY